MLSAPSLRRSCQPKASYRIARIVDRLTKEFKVYGETRKQILERHSFKDEDGKPKFTDKNQTAYDIDPAARTQLNADVEALREELIVLDIGQARYVCR
jgi:hypothetical protein